MKNQLSKRRVSIWEEPHEIEESEGKSMHEWLYGIRTSKI